MSRWVCETRDPDIINFFANHPHIAADIGGPIDMSGAIRETNIFLFGEHGGFCFEWTAPGTYEVHVMITRNGRGVWGFQAARQARDMIEEMGAERLWARVYPEHKALALFTMKAGFKEVETRTLYSPGPSVWRIFEWRKQQCLL
jgi:hypothetical protein